MSTIMSRDGAKFWWGIDLPPVRNMRKKINEQQKSYE